MSTGFNFSFSLGLKTEPKKAALNQTVSGFQPIEKKPEKEYITQIVNNQVVEDIEKKKELVIPVKQVSWIQKAKERIAREKELEKKRQQEEAENQTSVDNDVDVPTQVPSVASKATPVLDAKEEARMSILRDLLGDSSKSDTSDLVIPLRDKSTAQDTSKEGSTAVQNRLPGFNTMDRNEYFRLELASLPDACSVNSDAYKHVPIDAFGRASLLGMGWDGKNNVDPSVYEINIRPERLGLGAMPIVMNQHPHKTAVKKSLLEKRNGHVYTGVHKEWQADDAFAKGMQIGVKTGPLEGRQGVVIETPKPLSAVVKVLIDGEKQLREMRKQELEPLSDLVRFKSFVEKYGGILENEKKGEVLEREKKGEKMEIERKGEAIGGSDAEKKKNQTEDKENELESFVLEGRDEKNGDDGSESSTSHRSRYSEHSRRSSHSKHAHSSDRHRGDHSRHRGSEGHSHGRSHHSHRSHR